MTRTVLCAVAALLLAPAAIAATSGYDRLSFSEPASAGLEVQPPLDEFRAVSGARAVVPRAWARLSTTRSGRPRYMTRGGTCRFRITWTVRSVITDPVPIDDQLDAAIAVPRAHVYESGVRNAHPWRVVKVTGGEGTHIRGAWVGVLTRRKDVVPAGKLAWTHIVADARQADGECHSGTVHNAARQIADGLSIATSSLRFVRP